MTWRTVGLSTLSVIVLGWSCGVLRTQLCLADEPSSKRPSAPAGKVQTDTQPQLPQEAPQQPATPSAATQTNQSQTAEHRTQHDPLLEGLSDEVLERLEKQARGGQIPAEPEDPPLIRIGDRMRQVQQRLALADTGSETQALQSQIVKELDELLKKLQSGQACPRCGRSNCSQHGQSSPRAQSSSAAARSVSSLQPTTSSENADPNRQFPRGRVQDKSDWERMAKAVWGHLPPTVRERMEQALSAAFLPEYELLIERYFRTLAERSNSGQTQSEPNEQK